MIDSRQMEDYREPLYKRGFDILFSVLCLVYVLPVLSLIAVLIKIESLGPVFYWNLRIGLNGKKFKQLKFRTMRLDATKFGTTNVHELRDDPRITVIGRFLRRSSLDELPSIINVFKGDLSFVGPRPANPYEVEHYSTTQKLRLKMRPGLTGYWQVFGRENKMMDIDEMVKMDFEYAAKQSIWLDVKILWKTLKLQLYQKGAY